MTALQTLRDVAQVRKSQKVLVNGASGGVGHFAIQFARFYEAEVTAVCSTRNLDLVRSIGADHVIDYRRENITRNGQQYDLILAVNGYRPISEYLRALNPEGSYVVVGGSMLQLNQAASHAKQASRIAGKKIIVVSLVEDEQDLIFIKELLETGKITLVIDGCYPLKKASEI